MKSSVDFRQTLSKNCKQFVDYRPFSCGNFFSRYCIDPVSTHNDHFISGPDTGYIRYIDHKLVHANVAAAGAVMPPTITLACSEYDLDSPSAYPISIVAILLSLIAINFLL